MADDTPRAAYAVVTKVCDDGHIHLHLQDESGVVFATACLSPTQFADISEHILEEFDRLDDAMPSDTEPAGRGAPRSVN